MIKTGKFGMRFLLCLLFTITIIIFAQERVWASEVPLPSQYSFVFNGKTQAENPSLELKTDNAILSITSGNEWSPSVDVQWVSSAPTIVSTSTTSFGQNYIQLNRLRPGYATITATISSAGGSSFSISCQVEVNLEFNYQKTGTTTATTTGDRILVLNDVGDEKTIYLKYVDDDVAVVSGSAISADYVSWKSENEGVATVDSKTGKVKAVGPGSTDITVSTNTLSSDGDPMEITMKVVVAPKFKLVFDETAGYDSVSNQTNPDGIIENVPSNFDITSKATKGTNLNWEVYDCTGTTKKLINPATSTKMSYTVSEISGNVSFSNVKAGTYEIFAFADETFNENTNAPYAYMKIVVPIKLDEVNLVMTVGDTYDIIENSNVTGVGAFVNPPAYIEGDTSIARLDTSNYVITARKKGSVTIELTYNDDSGLFEGDDTPVFRINIKVIDGIALSATNVSLYTKSSYLLEAIVTDPTKTIYWNTSNSKVATVEGEWERR
jgi:hypothetical protein